MTPVAFLEYQQRERVAADSVHLFSFPKKSQIH